MSEQPIKVGLNESPSAKLIHLATYKRYLAIARRGNLYHFTSNPEASAFPQDHAKRVFFTVASADEFWRFKAKALVTPPDLVFIDSLNLWTDPLSLVKYVHRSFGAPIVMLCQPSDAIERPHFVKEAYRAGISDALYPPLHEEELLETMEVLLKLGPPRFVD